MSDSAIIWFILGPALGLALIVGWLTRNDPYSIEAANRYKEGIKKSKLFRVFQVEELLAGIGMPIALYFLFDALLGSLLLIGLGLAFYFRTNFLRGSLMSEGVNKTVGILYLVVGAVGFIFWIGCKA